MIKQNVKFFLPKESLNEATEYYCELIESAFDKEKYNVIRIDKIDEITKEDIVVSIRPGDFIKLKKSYKKRINWFQGIGPEEYILLHGNNFRSYLISKYLEYIEKKTILKSDICLFVSEKMKQHYEKKYKLNLSEKSLIIPCYNKALEKDLFNDKDRYKELNFVYAGGLFAWQCIDKTLLIFKQVNKLNPNAKLTLLTGDKKNAEQLVKKYEVKNVIIDYCKLNDLQKKLGEFKYAFLIRDNHIVNNVSTPTKMNSYLASGLIPIYTDVIEDFEKNIQLGSFALKFSPNLSVEAIASEIIQHHQQIIEPMVIYNTYEELFLRYYNDSLYIKMLRDKLES